MFFNEELVRKLSDRVTIVKDKNFPLSVPFNPSPCIS